ncbi:MAG: PaaI family thioesterase [Bacteroidetes bacterium]|nr:PaaI family thioesterase [Bacteroidota bacterium]
MRKILNPFTKDSDYKCFGCSPKNEHGLKLEFYEDGEYVISSWEPVDYLQGYINVLHGGIQTTLLDEIASWTVNVKAKTAGVTSNINISFKKVVYINKGIIKLKCKLIEIKRNIAILSAELYDSEDVLCTKAEIHYFLFKPEIAKAKNLYPGYENFF